MPTLNLAGSEFKDHNIEVTELYSIDLSFGQFDLAISSDTVLGIIESYQVIYLDQH